MSSEGTDKTMREAPEDGSATSEPNSADASRREGGAQVQLAGHMNDTTYCVTSGTSTDALALVAAAHDDARQRSPTGEVLVTFRDYNTGEILAQFMTTTQISAAEDDKGEETEVPDSTS